ncbi:MAG: hypothetical protein D6731_04080, partial [Planctomycetota bacterium]
MRHRALPLLALGLLVSAPLSARPAATIVPPRWDPEVVSLFESLPVQDAGRVKPLSTLAGFQLLRLRGSRTAYRPDGTKLTPGEWLLDCLFYPEVANTYEVFLVQNAEVLTGAGLGAVVKKRRARYSYDELKDGTHELFKRANVFSQKEAKQRTLVEQQTLDLARNLQDYMALVHALDLVRGGPLRVDGSGGLQRIFGKKQAPLSEVLAKARLVTFLFQQMDAAEGVPQETKEQEIAAIQELAKRIETRSRRSAALRLFAPAEPVDDAKEWLSPYDVVHLSFTGSNDLTRHHQLLGALESMMASRADPAAFRAALTAFHEGAVALASARGEYAKIPREVRYYQRDYFGRALLLFSLAFVLTAISWLRDHRYLYRAVWALTVLGAAAVTWGVADRCLIRGRPPVSTLYETILFVAGCGVWLSLFVEWLNRQRIALALATFVGMGGMFLAMRYEAHDGQDTMGNLVAVLDTNFWLATHVTCITLGYMGALVGALFGHVYLFGKLVGLKRGEPAFYRSVSRMTYGTTCFALLFSVVGTILGGIWANYSWGRFWGWDPKENGALLICLWLLAMLHARLGGYVKHWGFNALAVVGASVVAFSWWGVNLLGVGLHSYGFTSGVLKVLAGFYALEGLFVLVCLGHFLGTR